MRSTFLDSCCCPNAKETGLGKNLRRREVSDDEERVRTEVKREGKKER